MPIKVNHTQAQLEQWQQLAQELFVATGDDVLAMQIVEAAKLYINSRGLDTAAGYDYIIREAKSRLGPPPLDDIEYHEIMKAQEIMEELNV